MPFARRRQLRRVCTEGLLLAAVAVAYEGALAARFVFDDVLLLADLTPGDWPFQTLFEARKDGTAAGRPVMAFSWAVSIALAHWEVGARLPEPAGFVALNVALHAATGLVLFLLAARLFRGTERLAPLAVPLALGSASLWAVHPLTTSSVTYTAQRAEVLMALFFLLAVLCACRALERPHRTAWILLATLCAWLSVGSKEVGAMIPLAFWLLHRAFLGRSGGLRDHVGLYAGLASSWLLLVGLLATAPRTETVGWFSEGLHPLNYLLSQANALVHYARLVVWPSPLVVDYGWPIVQVHSVGDLWGAWPSYGPALVAVTAVLAVTVVGCFRAPRATLPLALCFAVLAPSSSILPINTEIMAEHRMYLPSAILLVGMAGVVGVILQGRGRLPRVVAVGLAVCLAGAAVAATRERNRDYAQPIELWAENARLTPQNSRAFLQWGAFLTNAGRDDEALHVLYRAADLAEEAQGPERRMLQMALQRLGRLEDRRGRPAVAIGLLERALEADPASYGASEVLLGVLIRQGLWERAEELVARVRETHPDVALLGVNVVLLDLRAGRDEEARLGIARELGVPPDDPKVPVALSSLARRAGRAGLAIELMREARGLP